MRGAPNSSPTTTRTADESPVRHRRSPERREEHHLQRAHGERDRGRELSLLHDRTQHGRRRPCPIERLGVHCDAIVAVRSSVVPTTIEFVDIAGPRARCFEPGRGARQPVPREHPRGTTAIVHVVRCFDDDNVVHVDGSTRSRARRRDDRSSSSASRIIETLARSGIDRANTDRQERRQAHLRKVEAEFLHGAATTSSWVTATPRAASKSRTRARPSLFRECLPVDVEARCSTSPTSTRPGPRRGQRVTSQRTRGPRRVRQGAGCGAHLCGTDRGGALRARRRREDRVPRPRSAPSEPGLNRLIRRRLRAA